MIEITKTIRMDFKDQQWHVLHSKKGFTTNKKGQLVAGRRMYFTSISQALQKVHDLLLEEEVQARDVKSLEELVEVVHDVRKNFREIVAPIDRFDEEEQENG